MASERPPGDNGRGNSQLPRSIPSRFLPRKPTVSSSPKKETIAQQQNQTRRKPTPVAQNTLPNMTQQRLQKRDPKASVMKKDLLPSNLPTHVVMRQDSSALYQGRPGLPTISRTPIFEPARTPSLVSGSSVSTGDSPRSNMLRRKASFGRPGVRASPDSASSREEIKNPVQIMPPYEDPYSDTVLGISLPPTTNPLLATKSPGEPVISLDQFGAYPFLVTTDLPPPTPQYAMSATSSSRLSPGVFSISSTPTSMTCYSPSLTTSGPRSSLLQLRQGSPAITRPPNSRKNTGESTTSQETAALSPARQNSSSSNSTVRQGAGSRSGKLSLPSSPKPVIENGAKRPVIKVSTHRVQSPSKTTKAITSPIQSYEYPELAHLQDASPLKSSTYQRPVPSRPSRDGTPDMNFTRASPIIQSNMASLPSSTHRRQASNESRKSIDTKSRFAISRKSMSRNPSPAPASANTPNPTAPTRGRTPDPVKDSEKAAKVQQSPREKSQSRFGFFKRSKPEPQPPAPAKEKRLRKGPAAGTGHEGYGKFAFRGRSGSTTSGTASIGRSSSADSIRGTNTRSPSSRKNSVGSKSGSDVDDFVAERLNPITLRGTGPVVSPQETDSVVITDRGRSFQGGAREIPMPSPVTVQSAPHSAFASPNPAAIAESSPVKPGSRGGDGQSGVDSKGSRFNLSNLSARRASRRSLMGNLTLVPPHTSSKEAFHFPAHPAINPLERKMSEPTPVVGMGQNASSASLTQRSETEPSPNTKTPKKWNFFQRSKTPIKRADKDSERGAVSMPKQLPPRAVAHYAMMDAPGKIDVFELEKIMLEAEYQTDPSAEEEDKDPRSPTSISKHGNSILLPAPPSFIPEYASPARPASPKVTFQADTTESANMPMMETTRTEQVPHQLPRGSRLPQVGRIPPVISHRERERKLSINSFSRPFDPSQPSPALQSTIFASDSNAVSPLTRSNERSLDVSPLIPSEPSDGTPGQPSPDPASFYKLPGQEHLDPADISSLAGILSGNGSVFIPSPQTQWIVDDVWNEYDDLLDSLSPQTPKTPKTPHTGSSLGAPFHYSMFSSPTNATFPSDPQFPQPTIAVPSVPNIVRSVRFPSMRESQAFLSGNLATPTSPASIADFLDHDGNRTSNISARLSLPSTVRLSSGSNRFSLPASIRAASSAHRRGKPSVSSIPESPPPESRKKRDSLSIQKSEVQTMGYENMINLRFGALMTSKWLSFGRVLFSPVHFELKNEKEDRVLILDGLGKGEFNLLTM
jgi:hypothetical protein